nr:MAG TPA: hypothetical protein [Caudoviricetes sp.]
MSSTRTCGSLLFLSPFLLGFSWEYPQAFTFRPAGISIFFYRFGEAAKNV